MIDLTCGASVFDNALTLGQLVACFALGACCASKSVSVAFSAVRNSFRASRTSAAIVQIVSVIAFGAVSRGAHARRAINGAIRFNTHSQYRIIHVELRAGVLGDALAVGQFVSGGASERIRSRAQSIGRTADAFIVFQQIIGVASGTRRAVLFLTVGNRSHLTAASRIGCRRRISGHTADAGTVSNAGIADFALTVGTGCQFAATSQSGAQRRVSGQAVNARAVIVAPGT